MTATRIIICSDRQRATAEIVAAAESALGSNPHYGLGCSRAPRSLSPLFAALGSTSTPHKSAGAVPERRGAFPLQEGMVCLRRLLLLLPLPLLLLRRMILLLYCAPSWISLRRIEPWRIEVNATTTYIFLHCFNFRTYHKSPGVVCGSLSSLGG